MLKHQISAKSKYNIFAEGFLALSRRVQLFADTRSFTTFTERRF
jgi:hypothetical protein